MRQSTAKDLDFLFDKIDDWLLADKFTDCDDFLANCEVTEYTVSELLTILSASWPASHRLSQRAAFFDRVRNEFIARKENHETLLAGLRNEDHMENA